MATLQDVRDRLERAVGRLEAAQKAYKDRWDAKLADVQREALVKALEETQQQNQALVDEREALADQVDAVIGRLRAVLTEGDDGAAGESEESAR
jgi:FtsZ-binding cell division protein ZapB